jgi:hypothetical protein
VWLSFVGAFFFAGAAIILSFIAALTSAIAALKPIWQREISMR